MSSESQASGKKTVSKSIDNFDKVIDIVSKYLSKSDIDQLCSAYDFAYKAHEGQYRKSGEPFVIHPVEVALILADLKMDADALTAALLHDTVEDSSTSLEDVENMYGPVVAELVDGVTKISRLEIETMSESQANNFRKMLVAMSKDIRVIVIKLADRLHNMRTLMALREDRRIFKARETMEIYAPLAHRLGINSIAWELEDLSFFYLEPVKFQQVSKMVAESRTVREEYLERATAMLRSELDRVGIKGSISGRPKHLYSIYHKMTQRGKAFSEIYDLIALRIIVDTVKDCYSALGAVHTLWHPMPGRFKDYIAMPKFNMYQSLHTTVIGPDGRPLEIQIRTEEMHRMNEYGIAAHWRYKEGGSEAPQSTDSFEEQLSWIRQMLDWEHETSDPKEFMESLRIDLFDAEVFVFTPKGEVVSLRAGSTPIDFAYAIHTEVGNHCVGAKVNGSIVPLSYELNVGDRVEILTQKNSSPSRDWLNIVKTPRARAKIRSYFSKASRDDDIIHGRDKIVRELRKHGIGFSSSASTRALSDLAHEMSFPSEDDLLAAVGTNKISERQITNRLIKILAKDNEEAAEAKMPTFTLNTPMAAPRPARKKRSETGVTVRGLDDALVRLSHCCNPVPGDEIVGFVTRGRGVSVHRADCPNAKSLLQTPERIISVAWDTAVKTTFQVEILVEAMDRMRLLQDVVIALANSGVNVLSSSTNTHRDGLVEMRFLFEVGATERLESILRDVRAVDGVFDAHRMLPTKSGKNKRA